MAAHSLDQVHGPDLVRIPVPIQAHHPAPNPVHHPARLAPSRVRHLGHPAHGAGRRGLGQSACLTHCAQTAPLLWRSNRVQDERRDV